MSPTKAVPRPLSPPQHFPHAEGKRSERGERMHPWPPLLQKVGSNFSPQGEGQHVTQLALTLCQVLEEHRMFGTWGGSPILRQWKGARGYLVPHMHKFCLASLIVEQTHPRTCQGEGISLSLRIAVPQSQFGSSAASCSLLFPGHCNPAATWHQGPGSSKDHWD